jgi:hypothetical protein
MPSTISSLPRDVLFVVHADAGGGHREGELRPLACALAAELVLALDHAAVRREVAAYLRRHAGVVGIVVGGGGGTLRAAIQGAVDEGAGERTCFAPLRFGSGNIVARRLGIPPEPAAAVEVIAAGLRRGWRRRQPVVRCRYGTADGPRDELAVALVGFGSLGPTAHDVGRTRRLVAHPWLRRWLTPSRRERVTAASYYASFALRTLEARGRPLRAICLSGARHPRPVLAGAVLTGDVAEIPCAVSSTTVALLERPDNPFAWRRALVTRSFVSPPDEIVRVDLGEHGARCFLDEDPIVASGRLTVVPGGVAWMVGGAA